MLLLVLQLLLRDYFVDYCRAAFCEESVLFLLDVNTFKQEAGHGLNGEAGRQIPTRQSTASHPRP